MRLVIRDLCKNYDEVTVIGNASYTFEQGRVYAIAGVARSGKTTLLECIGREVLPDGGSVMLSSADGLRKADYGDFGYVTREPVIMEYMAGAEYVRYCMELHGKEGREAAGEYFRLLGMNEELQEMLIREYTAEEKRALQMAGIMAADPPVILMDEPFCGDGGRAAERFIREMGPGHIIIMTTSSLEAVRTVSDEILLLNHGAIEGFVMASLEDRGILRHIESILTESGDENDA